MWMVINGDLQTSPLPTSWANDSGQLFHWFTAMYNGAYVEDLSSIKTFSLAFCCHEWYIATSDLCSFVEVHRISSGEVDESLMWKEQMFCSSFVKLRSTSLDGLTFNIRYQYSGYNSLSSICERYIQYIHSLLSCIRVYATLNNTGQILLLIYRWHTQEYKSGLGLKSYTV